MVANKGRICTKIGCRFDEKHQMRQPLNFFMAEWEGFEPSQPCDSNDLANRPLQPLEYCSKKMAGAVRIELTTYGFGDRCSTN